MFGQGKERAIRIAILIASLLGAGVMAYLTRLHFLDTGSAYCDISEGFSCSIVNKSIYSEVLGIPLAILGLVYFLAVPYLLFNPQIKKPYRWILLFSVFSLVFGLYLSGIEQIVLASVCIFCEISKVIMVVLIVLSAYGMKMTKEPFSINWIVGAVLVAALFSFVTYRLQQDPAPERDYTAVAQCLTEKGVYMYGAKFCPSCAKVKRDFGPAYDSLAYLECDPRFGEGNVVERCIARDIKKTPSFLLETPDGEVLDELVGAHSPEKIAEYFGCEEAL